MNSKTQRQTIELPLLLNMSDNRPEIHPDFKSAERINAPFINNMMSPLYKKVVESEYKTTFDKDDNKYEIKDGTLYRNDEKLFDVNNKKFVQTDVTSEYKQYSAFDFDDEGNLASLTENPDNSFTFSYKGNDTRIPPLYTVGRVLGTRIRCFGTRPILVIVYASTDAKAHIYIHDGTRSFNKEVVWCTQTPKQTYTVTTNNIRTTPWDVLLEDISPIIQISMPIENTLAISLATNYAEQLNTRKDAYYTFLEDIPTGRFLDGVNAKPLRKQETGEVTTTQYDTFTFSSNTSSDWKVVRMYRDDELIWRNADTHEELILQDHISPEETGDTIEIDEKVYDVYTQQLYTVSHNYVVTQDLQTSKKYTFSMVISSTSEIDETTKTANFTNNTATITFETQDWVSATGTITIEEIDIVDEDGEKHSLSGSQSIFIPTTVVTANSKIGWVIAPNFFLDDGTIRSWYTFNTWNSSTTEWLPSSQILTVSTGTLNIIIESADLVSVDYDGATFDFTSKEWHNIVNQTRITRNNCISVGQYFWSNSAVFSSTGMKTPKQLYVDKSKETTATTANKFVAYSNSNACDMRYYAGMSPNSDYKFYINAAAASVDVAWFNIGGFRVPVSRGNWNILYYNAIDSVSDIQGLSWSETPDMMGTLVAPWNKVDSSFYIVFTEDFMIYKDTSGRIWKVSIEDGNEISSLFDNSYIIINTTSYWNAFDVTNFRKYHYATDYNNRVKFGIPRELYTTTIANSTIVNKDSRLAITAINPAYNSSKIVVTSIQTPIAYYSFLYSDKTYVEAYQCEAPGVSSDIQVIDVFVQAEDENAEISVGGTSITGARYKYSILAQKVQTKIRENNLIGTIYSGTSTNYTPDIFARYINGAGNNDFIDEQGSAYPIAYNNINRPIFIYSLLGEVLNAQAFFVIQGQYYAVMNDKLYALSYYDGYIQNQDAVIDVRGMYFVGNTPEIAFFWSEKKKAFYSYTGDGILTQIFDATKYSLEKFSFKYFYDETVQSIWIPTTAGLLCFGVKNTFLVEDILDVEDVIFTADYTYIIQKDGYTVLKYFYEDGFEPIPIVLETSFYGVGNNEVSTIDRWQVTLYDERHPKIDVKLSVRSITDITSKAEDKTFHIGENDWDKWSHSVLLSYSPKLIKGQGIRLYIETPAAIQKIVPHVADQNYSSTTKFQL